MYGETGELLRTELTALLRQHRVQLALGGPGSRTPATSTPGEREQYGSIVRRYRANVLTWCAQSLDAARPMAFSNIPDKRTNPFTSSHDTPAAEELSRALADTRARLVDPSAELGLLTTPHDNGAVEHWRHAARAAALGEHDLNGAESTGRLSAGQAQAVLGDVATVLQAIVVLDQRYATTPGWQRLPRGDRLGWTALACALDVGLGQPDYSIDQTGWRPSTKPIRGVTKPGILGVLQAEHDLLVRLATFPNAVNLRLIVDSQRLVSGGLAALVEPVSTHIAGTWNTRLAAYTTLQQQLRGVGGQIGRGGAAVAEGATAADRLQRLPRDTIIEPRLLTAFNTVLARIDDRLADVIEQGVARGAYLVRIPAHFATRHDNRSRHVREHFVPAADPNHLDVVRTAREQLRPKPHSAPPASAGVSRVELQAALVHRPAGRTTGRHDLSL